MFKPGRYERIVTGLQGPEKGRLPTGKGAAGKERGRSKVAGEDWHGQGSQPASCGKAKNQLAQRGCFRLSGGRAADQAGGVEEEISWSQKQDAL